MKTNYQCIHETVLRDVIELVLNYANDPERLLMKFGERDPNEMGYMRNIARKSRGLTLEFPVIVSDSVSVESAGMIAKAIERKAVSMLQMLFSAISITNAKDAISYIKKFHTNLTLDGNIGVDDFADMMDQLATNEAFKVDKRQFDAVLEDFKRLTNYYLIDSINETGLDEYIVDIHHNGINVIKNPIKESSNHVEPNSKFEVLDEDVVASDKPYVIKAGDFQTDQEFNNYYANEEAFFAEYGAENIDEDTVNIDQELGVITEALPALAAAGASALGGAVGKIATGAISRGIGNIVDIHTTRKPMDTPQGQKDYSDYLRNRRDTYQNQQFTSDIKKVNEMVPSMMVIQFTYMKDDGRAVPVDTTAVVGVKAKLNYVTSRDMINRLVTKNQDRHGLFSFLKATTRQMSFWKDFVFAIDKAKLDAISSAGHGTSSPIWRLLENRAFRSKIRRWTGSVNDAAAISTLVISKEEADYLQKEEGMDVTRPSVVWAAMNAYNIMCFVVVDESLEKCSFLFDDGTNAYETYSFTHLEREDGGGQYKKIINLLAKSR